MSAYFSLVIWNVMMGHERRTMIEIMTEIGTGSVIEREGVKDRGRGIVRSEHGAVAGTGTEKGGGGGAGAGAGKKEEGKGEKGGSSMTIKKLF